MAQYCKNCLGAICDFCKWFDPNNDADGCYTGDGFCRRWQTPCDIDSRCGEFVCHGLKDGDPWYDRPASFNKPRTGPPTGTWVRTTPPDPPCPARDAPF